MIPVTIGKGLESHESSVRTTSPPTSHPNPGFRQRPATKHGPERIRGAGSADDAPA